MSCDGQCANVVSCVQMVKDKITLCREMLPESAGVDKDPAFSEVVGFLEVCFTGKVT